jgi:hypothetical protein
MLLAMMPCLVRRIGDNTKQSHADKSYITTPQPEPSSSI